MLLDSMDALTQLQVRKLEQKWSLTHTQYSHLWSEGQESVNGTRFDPGMFFFANDAYLLHLM